MRKKIICAVLIFLLVSVVAYGALIAYPKEQCGRIESSIREKQRDPEKYPGLTLTEDLDKACPQIRENLGL